MHFPIGVNYIAVVVAGVAIFMIGGVWYSALFRKQWIAAQGWTEADMKAAATGNMAGMYVSQFVTSMVAAWVLAVIMNHFVDLTPLRGALVGVLCWLGFTATVVYSNVVWNMKPKRLWVIDAGYYLIAYAVAGVILAVWR